jgi:hypothetical protein
MAVEVRRREGKNANSLSWPMEIKFVNLNIVAM